MRARIDISEVEAQTKIRAKYLRALENEEWDLLPGSVYVKSFLKTYGEYLGLDSRLLVDEFKRRYERPSDHDQRPTSPVASAGRDRGQRRSGRVRVRSGMFLSPPILVGVVIIAIVVALYLIGTIGSSSNNGKVSGGNLGTGTNSLTTSTNANTQTNSTTTPTKKKKRRPVTMEVVPTASIYVCVKAGNGKQLLVGTYTTGQTVPAVKAKTLLVTFGNANADVKVDGKSYPLTASSSPIGLKITHGSVKSLSPGPTCA